VVIPKQQQGYDCPFDLALEVGDFSRFLQKKTLARKSTPTKSSSKYFKPIQRGLLPYKCVKLLANI